MWSDPLDAPSRRNLVKRLREVLPKARPGARSVIEELDWRREPPDMARILWPRQGFCWVDQPRARLFANPLASLKVRGRKATIQGKDGTIRLDAGGFDLLEAALGAWGGPAEGMLCGYLGYELGAELEEVPRPRRHSGDLPDLYLGLYDWRLEHAGGAWSFQGTDAWRTIRARDIEPLVRAGQTAPDREWQAGPVSCSPPERFRDAVTRVVQRIHDGELFQVNICRRLEAPMPASGIGPLYQRMRAINPASHGALLRVGARSAVLSSSPELFLRVERGCVRSCPIKGTRPRGRTAEEDRALARALQECEKDKAELAMIVDVTRNDLARVCRAGSVAVTKHAELMTIPTLHHTYSEVTGVLRDECGPAELLRASFPPASITGAPKIRAMQVAAEEEGRSRGPAMGAIGWISLAGDLELSVAIRTAAASNGRVAYLAGCGITSESVPQAELEESAAKAAAFRRALVGARERVESVG